MIVYHRGVTAEEGGALWTEVYVRLDDRKSWEHIQSGPFPFPSISLPDRSMAI
jgi:hypothetical protein